MISSEYLKSLHKHIHNLCETKGMSIDLRWGCFGDINKFYINNKNFSLNCDEYCGFSIEDITELLNNSITLLCDFAICGRDNRIALYIEDIVYENSLYKVIFGACTFKDNSII